MSNRDDEEARSRWEQHKEHLKAQDYSFEGAVKNLEALCLRYAPKPDDADPERFSDGWYAREISLAIRATRDLLKREQPRHAAAEALNAGSLAGAWPAARQWREQQEARRRGGREPKHLSGLQAVVDRLAAEHPNATAKELWDLIPESEDDLGPIGGFSVYRDGSKVIQADRKGEKPIKFPSFRRYVTRARSK